MTELVGLEWKRVEFGAGAPVFRCSGSEGCGSLVAELDRDVHETWHWKLAS